MIGPSFQVLGRYVLGSPIGSGGMATVYLARPLNLPRAVALKRLRPELSSDPTFIRMFLDEVQLLARIRHKNVVTPIDHFERGGEFFMVMDLVEGLSLAELASGAGDGLAPALASKIIADALAGLDAAHEAVDCRGQPLNLVHRDVSPHNILVGTDGEARVIDFGIAKAAWRAHVTQHGEQKGKPGYMAPEQLGRGAVDRTTDVYAAGIVLWELLTGTRLYPQSSAPASAGPASPPPAPRAPSAIQPRVPAELDRVILRALSPQPRDRYDDAKAMAEALVRAAPPASSVEVGAWVAKLGRHELARRRELVAALEKATSDELVREGASSVAPSATPGSPSETFMAAESMPVAPRGASLPPPTVRSTPAATAPSGGGARKLAWTALAAVGLAWVVQLATSRGRSMSDDARPRSSQARPHPAPPLAQPEAQPEAPAEPARALRASPVGGTPSPAATPREDPSARPEAPPPATRDTRQARQAAPASTLPITEPSGAPRRATTGSPRPAETGAYDPVLDDRRH